MSKHNRRCSRRKAQEVILKQSTYKNDISHLETSSNQQNLSYCMDTAEDTPIQTDTAGCQKFLLEEESSANLLSPTKKPSEENMHGKKKKKKNSKKIYSETITKPEVVTPEAELIVQLSTPELQELDMNIEANSSNRKPKRNKKKKPNIPTSDPVVVDTSSAPQPLTFEVESGTKLYSPEPQKLVLSPIEDSLEQNMSRKKKGKKKRKSKNISTEAMTNSELTLPEADSSLQLPDPKLHELDIDIGANSYNRKPKNKKNKKKKNKLNMLTSDGVDMDTAAQPLALEVESSVDLHSLKPQELVLNPTEDLLGEHMSGIKNRKTMEKSKNISTEAMTNPEVTLPQVDPSLQFLAPDLQKQNLNIEAIGSSRKHKKKRVNKPASDVVILDSTTSEPLPLEHQVGCTSLTKDISEQCQSGQKSSNRKRKKKTNATSNAADVHTMSGPQPLELELQEMETKLTKDTEELNESVQKCSSSNGKKKKKKKNLTCDAAVINTTTCEPQPFAKELQEMDTSLTKDIEEQNESDQKYSNGKKKRKKKNLASNVGDTESTGQVLVQPESLERVSLSPIGIDEKNENGRKRKRGEIDVELAAQMSEPENQEKEKKAKNVKGQGDEIDHAKTATQVSLSSRMEETEALCADSAMLCCADLNEKHGSHLASPEKISAAESCIDQNNLSSGLEVTMESMDVGRRLKRKLLILDLNGLLADIIMPPPKDIKPDTSFLRRAVFKRPFCDDFLKFCFERFDVAIWSSRTKRIIDRVVDYLLGDLKHKLLFCWDMSHATPTKFKTLENNDKPLVCKDLRKIWDPPYPGLPWKKGDYDESNTLLLDDSPYKALLNPAHTTIFPYSYNFRDKHRDNSLGPGGDLRLYLEKLADAEHIQKFVEQHPFGQSAISEKHPSWGFYSQVINSLSS
ncbi:unnamed protein product [Cuscuta epithymum]|uniref:FCP1 homology domain-containing protein n=1 Tax=Cuscuta epithymum TaxID=186058 RepID=A0AAV0EA46_9ASTE|nr:unnamed protein product [Cuscuta epithymum]